MVLIRIDLGMAEEVYLLLAMPLVGRWHSHTLLRRLIHFLAVSENPVFSCGEDEANIR